MSPAMSRYLELEAEVASGNQPTDEWHLTEMDRLWYEMTDEEHAQLDAREGR